MSAKVWVYFFDAHAGGRHRPPVGPTYTTVARFLSRREDWSVLIHLPWKVRMNTKIMTVLELVSPQAPPTLITPGQSFVLVEGQRDIAMGQVLPP